MRGHLGLRRSELFVHLSKDDVQFKKKEDRSKYVTMKGDLLTKKYPGGLRGQEFSSCGSIENETQVKVMRRLLAMLRPS